jgi:hypothetical protein
MDLREMLVGVAELSYASNEGQNQPAQQHLQRVRAELRQLLPAGFATRVSGSGQSLPHVPWIGVFDPEVTVTAQEGLYVVYLYRRDLSVVYLSMNQGVTQHRQRGVDRGLGPAKAEVEALLELHSESELLQERLGMDVLAGTVETIELGGDRFLPRAYEAGNIAALEYALEDLPSAQDLFVDLSRFLAIYGDCVEIKNELNATHPGLIHTTAAARQAIPAPTVRPPQFRPKSAEQYIVEMPAQRQARGRRHEALLTAFAGQVRTHGLVIANNVHPRDAVVVRDREHWLIEAKTVTTNAEDAVRAAIGQLFAYRHFYYRARNEADPRLVALFSEPVGDAFVGLLTSLDIEAIWHLGGDRWAGLAPAHESSLLRALS